MEFKLVFRPDDIEQFIQFTGNLKKTDKVITKRESLGEYLNNNNKVDLERISIGEKPLKDNVIIERRFQLSDLKNSKIIDSHFGALKDYFQLMNPYELSRSVYNKELNIELIPALMIMDAVFYVQNLKGKNVISLEDYFDKFKAKQPHKIIEIIAGEHNGNSGYYNLVKGNYINESNLSAAVYLEIKDGKIIEFKAALGGNGITPFRAYEIENLVIGKDKEYLFSDRIMQILSRKAAANIKGKVLYNFSDEEFKGVYTKAVESAFSRVDIL